MIISDLFLNALGQMIGEVLGETIEQKLDRRALLRELRAAVARTEARFAREYRAQDAELTDALSAQTRFTDLASVQVALRELLTRPFHDPSPAAAVLRQSFADVLPERVDRARVDAAVQAFLGYLGQEVLYIPQLRELYALAFQKMSVAQSRAAADHAAALVQGIQELRDDMRQIAAAPPLAALPPPVLPAARRPLPWHNMPQRSYTRFVGRQAELEKLTQLLLPHPRSRHFVVTLDGIGGVGKSALALELAYRYRDGYAELPEAERFDAIVWISAKRTLLTASGIQQRQQTFNTLTDMYREIATVLEQPGILQADAAHRRGLVEHALTAQRTLLIVDNLETVDDEELLTFLRELPDPTKAIVTTRHRIDIAYSIRLAGMPEPDAQALMIVEAARKGVELPPEATGDLYRRSGGIPLAIVWSIGLMSMGHSVESVLRRLGSGHSDIARFCFAESMARIRGRDAERLLFTLALFERSVNRQMLGEVAGLGNDVIGRDDGLAELLQLSLVDQKGDRFKLLPLTHSFALEELAQQSELDRELRERWIGGLTGLASPFDGPHWQHPSRSLLKHEGNHLVTLANWAERYTRPDVLLSILPALFAYYDFQGQWAEMLTLGQIGLEYARLTGDRIHLRYILNMTAWISSQQGHQESAKQAITEAYEVAAGIGEPAWQCEILINSSQISRRESRFDRAMVYCRQALDLLPMLDEYKQPYVRGDIDIELGKIARDQGDWQTAKAHFDAARAVFRRDIENPVFNIERAWGAYSQAAYVTHQIGELEIAAEMYRESLDPLSDYGSRGYFATVQLRYALLEEQRGNLQLALEHAQEALEWSRKLGMMQEIAQAEALLAKLAEETPARS
jgi:LuxR family glucitol operon transcriptional activator